MKKKLSLLLLICILSALNINAEIYNGSCGDNVNYSLNTETGLLSITGSGAMTNYNSTSSVPWYSNRSSITAVEISDGVTSIGSSAFRSCLGLTSVTIPNSVTSIGGDAFWGCSGLTSITIPNSVTSIGSYAFGSCYFTEQNFINNSSLDAEANNYWGATIVDSRDDGFVIKDGTLLKYTGNDASVTIPNSVTIIGSSAFKSCSNLTSVTIPNSVTSIGEDAFWKCYGLTSVTIPNSVTSIGSDAFRSCSGLASISVENGNTNYDSRNNCNAIIETASNTLIAGCKNTVIPNSVTSIGSYAFYDCSGLTSVTIPNSVTIIGSSAFKSCSNLTSVTIPNSVTSIGNYAFQNCSGLTSITIPNSVTSIGNGAFAGCSGLTSISVENGNEKYDSRDNCNAIIKKADNILIAGCKNTTIPNSVTSIGNGAFGNCELLTSITIPNSVTSIGGEAFWGCSGLTSVTIPNSVTSIGENAFFVCSGLTSVIIPNSVTSIGTEAFEGCSGLTSVIIPNSVTNIGVWAFGGCSGLTSVISEIEEPFAFGTNAFNGISSSCTLGVPYGTRDAYIAAGWTTNVFKGGIVEMEPDDANIISGSCGENVNYSLNLETGVLSITGTGAMTDYSSEEEVPWYAQRENINSIEIADGVTTIGNNAFHFCVHLTSFDIPNSVTAIGQSAFERCDNLSSLTIGNSVTSIGQSAFEQCPFTSIEIPSSVTSIGHHAFWYCTHLTSIVVADGNTKYDSRDNCNAIIETATNTMVLGCKNTIIPNSVTSIGDLAFSTCTDLTSIEIPSSVKSIGTCAFERCHSLTSVTIPNSVTEIGVWAFSDCNSLTSINIPNSVTSIQACAFNRTGLTSVEIPNSVTLIEERVFEDCSGLTSIDIPNSVTSIGYAAFNRCTGLTSIEIPGSVTEIREEAFNDCSSLTEVYCYAENVPNTEANVFKNVDLNNATLYVPAASIEAYQAAEPWSQFGNIMKIDTDISQMDNVMYVESFEGHSASQVIMPIQMKNSAEIRGFQFNLYLPDGVTIALNPKGKEMVSLSHERRDEYDEHTLSVRKQDDGSYLFLCGSLSEDTFLGNNGEVATVTLDIAEEMDNGNYPIILKNIKLTENDISKYYETPQVRSTLTVVSYVLGDINDDGKIDVSDYIGIANHILGNTPEDFNLRAADVDENGVIDVSDYIGVANIILTGSIYGSQQ